MKASSISHWYFQFLEKKLWQSLTAEPVVGEGTLKLTKRWQNCVQIIIIIINFFWIRGGRSSLRVLRCSSRSFAPSVSVSPPVSFSRASVVSLLLWGYFSEPTLFVSVLFRFFALRDYNIVFLLRSRFFSLRWVVRHFLLLSMIFFDEIFVCSYPLS